MGYVPHVEGVCSPQDHLHQVDDQESDSLTAGRPETPARGRQNGHVAKPNQPTDQGAQLNHPGRGRVLYWFTTKGSAPCSHLTLNLPMGF